MSFLFKQAYRKIAVLHLEVKHIHPNHRKLLTNWFMVGCSHPVVMAFTVAIASKPPAAPRQCPIIDWQKIKVRS